MGKKDSLDIGRIQRILNLKEKNSLLYLGDDLFLKFIRPQYISSLDFIENLLLFDNSHKRKLKNG